MNEPRINCRESDGINPPCVMVVGDVNRTEMVPLFAWLEERVLRSTESKIDPHLDRKTERRTLAADNSNVSRIFALDIETALGSAVNLFPDLIVVLQCWPNEYSRRNVDRLFAFAPLARIVVCYGAWCESDGRNHSIWPHAVRVPVWAAQSRIEKEWALLRHPSGSTALPWSASREELFAADHPSISTWPTPRTFFVDSPDQVYEQSLIEIMTFGGHGLDHENPQLLLFDADPWGTSRADALQTLKEKHPRAIIVALLNLAEPLRSSELCDLGVTTIRHKLGFC